MDLDRVMNLIVGGAGCLLTCYGVWTWRRAQASASWPTVNGRIVGCRIREQNNDGEKEWRVIVSYEYEVLGVSYVSDRVGYGREHPTVNESQVMAVGDMYPLHSTVLVHYDPEDPSVAVLEGGNTGPGVLMAFIGAAITFFFLGQGLLG